MVYGMTDIGRNIMGLSSRPAELRPAEFWAVKNVSFEIKRGETLGLIGPNGSGKTTLLKMINGIFWPDKGKITVKGRVGALIAVGAGFHPLLSGRENIYVNAAILGMTKKEVDKKFDAIVDFADIGNFLDVAVKNYSSGMFVRLGFAVAVHCEPDVLLIDEVLAVGDIQFQSKCMSKMREMDKQGVTKIFISHNLNSVQLLCKNTLYISQGVVQQYGDTQSVINECKKDALSEKGSVDVSDEGVRHGTKEIEITKVEFIDRNNNVTNIFKRGESLEIKIKFFAKNTVENPEFVVGFASEHSIRLSSATTRDHGIPVGDINGHGEVTYVIESLPLTVGKYFVTVGCWDATGHFAYDHHRQMYDLVIEDGAIDNRIRERFGFFYIPSKWNIKKGAN